MVQVSTSQECELAPRLQLATKSPEMLLVLAPAHWAGSFYGCYLTCHARLAFKWQPFLSETSTSQCNLQMALLRLWLRVQTPFDNADKSCSDGPLQTSWRGPLFQTSVVDTFMAKIPCSLWFFLGDVVMQWYKSCTLFSAKEDCWRVAIDFLRNIGLLLSVWQHLNW